MSKKKDTEALIILESVNLRNGGKQIAMIQQANCLYRLMRFSEAIEKYQEAIESETTWGMRKNPDDREYLIGYSQLFIGYLTRKSGVPIEFHPSKIYDKLLKLKTSSGLKTRYLPLPPKSSIT